MDDARTKRMDRTSIELSSFDSPEDDARDLVFWRSLTPRERIEGIEFIRQSFYKYNPISERLPRLLEIVEFA